MQFLIKLTNSLILSLALLGCAASKDSVMPHEYDPNDSARIRLFGQNQKPSTIEWQVLEKSKRKLVRINVGGNLNDALGSFAGTARNESIGMPETENTRNLAKRNGILSKAIYKEFYIPVDGKMEVYNSFIGLISTTYMAGGISVTHGQKAVIVVGSRSHQKQVKITK